ncbi:c-type cytochrome [Phenylobacterium sp. LjRoot219]|uniref:c-type cytochrome n=1 Tax=Phenylobacterium sp. LjRoot219 TaxID=3342283 RepID=UPI003ECDEE17
MRNSRLIALSLLLAAAAPPAMAQDAAAGAVVFRQRCQTCHTTTPGQRHGVGPNLAGLPGRAAASTDFNYSSAMKGSGLVWNAATLDRFIAAPSKVVPGTRMLIPVTDAKQRADLVAYLASLK